MDDIGITVEHSLSEQPFQNDNQHDQSLPQNHSDLPSSKKEIKMAKAGPVYPTPLYVSLCPSRSSLKISFVLQTILLVHNIFEASSSVCIYCLYSASDDYWHLDSLFYIVKASG